MEWVKACKCIGVMMRFLWSGATGRDVMQLFYILWTRISTMVVVIWAALSGADSWTATIGLGVVLVLLLLGGVVLLVLGVRDLVRDVRRYLHHGHGTARVE